MTPALIALAAVLLLAQSLLVVLVPVLRARHDRALRRVSRPRVLVVHRRGRRPHHARRTRAVTRSHAAPTRWRAAVAPRAGDRG